MSNPTSALLWAACRPEMATEAVRAAVAAGADLADATERAIVERVSPLLYRSLEAAGSLVDEPWARELELDTRRCHAQSRMVLPRVGALGLAPLAEAGFTALVIKGGALVDRYPDPGLRPMDDVDVILPRAQVDDAVALLCRSGWRVQHNTRTNQKNEIALAHPDLPGLHIDMHRALATWRSGSNQLTAEQLWDARLERDIFGASAYVVPPAIEIVLLATHAAKPYHAFDRLIWSVDLAVVINTATAAGGLDWAEVQRRTADAAATTAVAVALTQARRLGAEVPAFMTDVDFGRRASALAPVLSEDWPTTDRGWDLRNQLRYAVVDSPRLRAALFAAEVIGEPSWRVPWKFAWMTKRTAARALERRRAAIS